MAELFIEIFSEEIPARMQERAGADLAKALTGGLKKAGLSVDAVQSFTGPRRLVFTADVPLKSPDISDERKGPRVGAPEQALAGFMKAAGLSDISEAEIKEDKKGQFYIARIEKSGQPSADIVKALLPEIMTSFPWPKSMKSGGATFRWVRPLQGIICLLDGDIIDLTVGGVTSGRTTKGHRRHGAGPFTVKDFADYKAQLEGVGHVVLDAQARKDKILADAKAVCAAKGLELSEDIGLLNEVSGLAEWPVVILGDMDPAFLELPDEVIRLTLKSHQKTFTVRDPKTGKLAAHYIIVANQVAPDGGEAIKKGNGKVISARLSDARFFQTEDAKKPLIEYYDQLGTVVFHKKLGSIQDKAERVASLAKVLAPKVGADPDKAEAAAKLAKCDLVTQTVVEFTSLEGQIGALMYTAKGGDEDIALAIEQHYKPKGPSDTVPTNPVAVAVALADKLDTLAGFWAIDEKPTGSKDSFALRRAALGVVRIILENDVRLDLFNAIGQVLLYALHHGFKEASYWQNDFYTLLGRFSNVLDDTNVSTISASWRYYPYSLYLDENGLITIHGEKISSAQIGFEGISPPYGAGQIEILQESEGYYKTLKQRLASLDRYEEKLDLGNMLLNGNGEVQRPDFSIDEFPLVAVAAKTIYSDLLAFILDRLKVYLKDKGIRHDVIDAALSKGGDDLVAIVNRVEALQAFLGTDEGENLMAGYKRAANILKAEAKKGDLPNGAPLKPEQAEAVALYEGLQAVAPAIKTALTTENYALAMQNLAKLRGPIDAFFTHVTVISDDSAVKENNLRLLLLIRDTARQIADFEAIQG